MVVCSSCIPIPRQKLVHLTFLAIFKSYIIVLATCGCAGTCRTHDNLGSRDSEMSRDVSAAMCNYDRIDCAIVYKLS